MPIPGARYRWKKTKKGKIRLAFVNNKVVEVKKKSGEAKKVGNSYSHLRKKVLKTRASY